MIHLATGIALREGRLLLVASSYPNHPRPLWNLPGGRQLPGELLEETVVREVLEEAGIAVAPREIAYLSESYDSNEHFLNVTFLLDEIGHVTLRQAQGDTVPVAHARSAALSEDPERGGRDESKAQGDTNTHTRADGDHVVAVEWVPIDAVAERMTIAVVREPLVAFLRGELPRRYAGFHDAGVTIEWPADSR